EPESLIQRLLTVCEFHLVALGAAEELDSSRSFCSPGLGRIEPVHEPGGEAAKRGIEPEAVAVHPPLEHEVADEGDRAAVEAERDDPRHVELGKLCHRLLVEVLSGPGAECRAVRPSLPAEVVDPEGVLQSRAELVARASDLRLRPAQLRELPEPPPMKGAVLLGELGPVDGVPIRGQVEHRSLGSHDQTEAWRAEGACQLARSRQAEEIREVVFRGGRPLGQTHGDRGAFSLSEEQVGEGRVVSAEEGENAEAYLGSHDERQGADEIAGPEGDLNSELASLAV